MRAISHDDERSWNDLNAQVDAEGNQKLIVSD